MFNKAFYSARQNTLQLAAGMKALYSSRLCRNLSEHRGFGACSRVLYFIVIIVVISGFAACKNPVTPPTANSAPYKVTASIATQTYNQGSGDQTFQLEIEQVAGLDDPDGDVVSFKSSVLPAWISLDEATGVVTVDTTAAQSSTSVDFWSEDENGEDTSGAAFSVLFSVNSAPNPLVGPTTYSIARNTSVAQTVQLQCSTNVDGSYLYDLEGDTVTVIVDSATPLPSYMVLDSATGEITVISASGGDVSINFWTVDDKGGTTESIPLTVDFTLYDNSNPYDIIGPVGPVTSMIDVPYNAITSFTLDIDDVGGLNDPDGHDVVFFYDINQVAPGAEEDVIINLNAQTGVFTITHLGVSDPNKGGYVEFLFWTDDQFGGISTTYSIWFSYSSN